MVLVRFQLPALYLFMFVDDILISFSEIDELPCLHDFFKLYKRQYPLWRLSDVAFNPSSRFGDEHGDVIDQIFHNIEGPVLLLGHHRQYYYCHIVVGASIACGALFSSLS